MAVGQRLTDDVGGLIVTTPNHPPFQSRTAKRYGIIIAKKWRFEPMSLG
jgi:hypothetical protein